MPERVVLSEMVVKLVADTKDYQRQVKQAEQTTQGFGAQLKTAAKGGDVGLADLQRKFPDVDVKARTALDNIKARGERTGTALQRLGMIAKKMSFGTLGLGAIGGGLAGLGAAGAAIGVVVSEVKRLIDLHHQANAAGNQAFQSVVTGSRTAAQAINDIRINGLTEGFRDLQRYMNPESFGDRFSNFRDVVVGSITGQGGLEVVMQRIIERVHLAQAAFQELENNQSIRNLRRVVSFERNVQGANDMAQALEEVAARSGMAANEAARYEQAQRLAREADIRAADGTYDVARAQRLLATQFERQRRAQDTAIGRDLARDMQMQVRSFGLSAEAAQLLRLRTEGVSEASLAAAAASAQQLQALRRLQAPMERIEAVAASSAEAQFRVAEFQQRRAFQVGAAQIAGQIAPRPAEGALSTSAEAQTRGNEVPQILRDIRMILRSQGSGPQVEFSTLGLQE